MPRLIPILLLPALVAGPRTAFQEPVPANKPATPPAAERPAAPEPSAAERAYRDAWWAESGQNDLAAALRGYLAAATADGPPAIRARAMVRAGAVQQRLGKPESALATLRQLLKEFPAEAEAVEQARTQLRELTAADLGKDYDEWYERRLFSEEVQLQVLDRIQAVADHLAKPGNTLQELAGLECRITAYGRAAVPALRKTCSLGNARLAARAVSMLFSLSVVPPIEALLDDSDWSFDAMSWTVLLRTPPTGAGGAHPTASGGSAAIHAVLLDAVRRGAPAFAAAIVAAAPGENETPTVQAAAQAAWNAGPEARALLLRATGDRGVALATRRALQGALTADPVPPLAAADWLGVGREPLAPELRFTSLQHATQELADTDGEALEEILARVEAAPAAARASLLQAIDNGLQQHRRPLQMPWTASRLQRLLTLHARTGGGGSLRPFLLPLRTDATWRGVLAEALLAAPGTADGLWHATDNAPAPSLAEHFANDGDPNEPFLDAAWNEVLAQALAAHWPQWNEVERAAALRLLTDVVHEGSTGRALRAFCAQAVKDVSPALRDALGALRQRLVE